MNKVYILKQWKTFSGGLLRPSCYEESAIAYFLNEPTKKSLQKHLHSSFYYDFTIEDLLEESSVCISYDDFNSEGYFFEIEDLC